jgi:AraC-like DNA-binding protein
MSDSPLLKNLGVERFKGGPPIRIHQFDGEKFGYHSHDYLEMMIVTEDGGRHVVDGKSHYLKRGEVYLLGPYNAHAGFRHQNKNPKYFNIEFFPETLALGSDPLAKNDNLVLRPFYHPLHFAPILLSEDDLSSAVGLCQSLFREQKNKSQFFENASRHILSALLHLVARHAPAPKEKDTVVLKSLQLINEHFQKEIVSEQLAARFGLSSARLAQIFKSATGKTLKETLSARRLIEAKSALLTTSESITEIMLKSGFNDASYFHRTFKKATGISPKVYRSRFAQKGENGDLSLL